ncbi:MAG: S1C family serine protease [Planctomycetota bacterium]
MATPLGDSPFKGFLEGDLGKIFEEFRKRFDGLGEGNGDLGKILEDLMRRFLNPDERPAPRVDPDQPRAYLGIQTGPGEGIGVEVRVVNKGTAAEKGGLRVGDRIIRFGGKPVADLIGLRALLRSRKPGEKVSLTVIRKGEKVTLEVTLGKRTRG